MNLTAGTKEVHMLVHYHDPHDRTHKTVTLSSKYLSVAVTRKLNSIFFHTFTDIRLGWYSCTSWSPKSTPPLFRCTIDIHTDICLWLYRLIARGIWCTVPSRQLLSSVLKQIPIRLRTNQLNAIQYVSARVWSVYRYRQVSVSKVRVLGPRQNLP